MMLDNLAAVVGNHRARLRMPLQVVRLTVPLALIEERAPTPLASRRA